MSLSSLSAEELRDALIEAGLNPGPITATTRAVWEKRLASLHPQANGSPNGSPPKAQCSPRKASPRKAAPEEEEEEEEEDALEGETSFRKLPSPISSRPSWEAGPGGDGPFRRHVDSPYARQRSTRSSGRLYPDLPGQDEDQEEAPKAAASLLATVVKAALALVAALFLYFLFVHLSHEEPSRLIN